MALTQINSNGITDGSIVNADIGSSAAIAGSKLADDSIAEGKLDIHNAPSNGKFLKYDGTNGMEWGDVPAGVGGSNGADFNDNVKARFGTGNDLEIYHNGTHSYIADEGTGELNISGSRIQLLNAARSEKALDFVQDGAVDLYHNGNKKLATKSDGVDITGELQCDSLDVDGNVNINNGADTSVTIQGTGDVVLTLNADTDDNNEAHHPELRFTQDGSQNVMNIGITGQNGENFTNSTGNNPYIHVTTAHGGNCDLEIATNGVKRLVLDQSGHLRPASTNTYDLGTSSLRWRNLYTNDLNLSNEGSTNDVDGTWGSWTIQEGEDDLFLLNRRNGKKYKFNLTEVN